MRMNPLVRDLLEVLRVVPGAAIGLLELYCGPCGATLADLRKAGLVSVSSTGEWRLTMSGRPLVMPPEDVCWMSPSSLIAAIRPNPNRRLYREAWGLDVWPGAGPVRCWEVARHWLGLLVTLDDTGASSPWVPLPLLPAMAGLGERREPVDLVTTWLEVMGLVERRGPPVRCRARRSTGRTRCRLSVLPLPVHGDAVLVAATATGVAWWLSTREEVGDVAG